MSACNVLVDTSTDQCSKHADCTKKGGEFAGTFCTADKICGSWPCTTSNECTERAEEPAFCRGDGRCARVFTAECTRVVPAGALSEDDVVLAGFMGPVSGPFASSGTPVLQAAELALVEMENVANGMAGADLASPRRHLAMLVCHDTPDDRNTLDRPMRVARHLVSTLGVPAILGPSKIPTNALDVITEVTGPAGVLTLSPSLTHAAIRDLDASHLFWRTVPPDSFYATLWPVVSQLVVQSLWAYDIVPDGEVPRTVYVARSDEYGAGLSQAVLRQSSNLPIPGWSYDLTQKRVDWDSIADAVVAKNPHVVIAFSTGEFVTQLLPRIEERWPVASSRPYYLLFDGARVKELSSHVDASPELAKRVLLVAPGARTAPSFDAFRSRFQSAFGEEPGTLAEFAYDAAYLFAYAVAGSRQQHPTGFELKAALERMSCDGGTRVEADPQAFFAGASAPAEEPCLDFEGVSGPLDFDELGETAADYGLWCAGRRDFQLLEGRLAKAIYLDKTTAFVQNLDEGELLPFCSAPP